MSNLTDCKLQSFQMIQIAKQGFCRFSRGKPLPAKTGLAEILVKRGEDGFGLVFRVDSRRSIYRICQVKLAKDSFWPVFGVAFPNPKRFRFNRIDTFNSEEYYPKSIIYVLFIKMFRLIPIAQCDRFSLSAACAFRMGRLCEPKEAHSRERRRINC